MQVANNVRNLPVLVSVMKLVECLLANAQLELDSYVRYCARPVRRGCHPMCAASSPAAKHAHVCRLQAAVCESGGREPLGAARLRRTSRGRSLRKVCSALRVTAAQHVARRRHGDVYASMQPRVMQTYSEVLANPARAITAVYGAVVGTMRLLRV